MHWVTARAKDTDPSRTPVTITDVMDVSRDSVIFLRFVSARCVSFMRPCGFFPLLYLSLDRASPPTAVMRHRQLSDSSKKTNKKKQTCQCFDTSLTPPTDTRERELSQRFSIHPPINPASCAMIGYGATCREI